MHSLENEADECTLSLLTHQQGSAKARPFHENILQRSALMCRATSHHLSSRPLMVVLMMDQRSVSGSISSKLLLFPSLMKYACMVQASLFHACHQPRNSIYCALSTHQPPWSNGHAHDKNTCVATPFAKTNVKLANVDDTESTTKSLAPLM